MVGVSRETTVVRIPLKSAKHHFGACVSRGSRPYNEDTYQAGTIEIPAFARRRPISLTRRPGGDKRVSGGGDGEGTSADSAAGDPQVFYFGVFDGHGGSECADFLREQLHQYVEDVAKRFGLESSLRGKINRGWEAMIESGSSDRVGDSNTLAEAGKQSLDSVEIKKPDGDQSDSSGYGYIKSLLGDNTTPPQGEKPLKQSDNVRAAEELERSLVSAWRDLVGGYFKRFKPEFFSLRAGGQGHILESEVAQSKALAYSNNSSESTVGVGIEAVLTYAFLKADFDFVSAQAGKHSEDPVSADRAINEDVILDQPYKSLKPIGGPKRFRGGSTCSVALISTPTPTPFWHPASPSTLITAHVGDTRILLCRTSDGASVPMTSNHHPSLPSEATRLRRYAATFVTDSFGEERVSGLANTRAFGDMSSKRIGVSAEPEIRRVELGLADYSFIVLVSDGVSGTLTDQEIVDIVKEARTPEQGARDLVAFATEVGNEPDNATALCVRLGGWERRSEGGLGSLGTKESRDWRKREALDPRTRRQ